MFLALIRKDLVRRWRSPIATLVMLAFPFMMAGLIGSVSGGSGSSMPQMTVFVLDRDAGLIGGFLTSASPPADADVALELVEVGEEGFERMGKGEASAMIVIPEGFTDDLLDRKPVTLELVRNPAESIKPEIVEQGLIALATYLDVAVKVLGDELGTIADMVEADQTPSVLLVTQLAAKIYEKVEGAQEVLFPPVVKVVSTKEQSEGSSANVFGYVLVMVSVMSVLFVAIRAVSDLYEDRRTGMLRRQLSAPIGVGSLVMAKILFAVVFGMIVMGILLVAGSALGWFASGAPVAAVLLLTICYAFAAAGLMVLIVSLVSSEKQAGILSWIVVMTMSVLGGSMMPVEAMPAAMQSVARFSLNYWAVEGYLDLLVRELGPSQVLPHVVILGGLGLVFTLAGQFSMRRRLQEALG